MISLEQIRTLEERVRAAVKLIRRLTDENLALTSRLESYESRITELQELVTAFKSDQEAIEAGIVAALGHLDELEDAVVVPETAATASAPHASAGSAAAPARSAPAGEPARPRPANPQTAPIDDAPTPAETGEADVDEPEDPELDIF